MNNEERRYAFAGIIIEDRQKSASAVQEILSEHSSIISGRMGIPNLDQKSLSIITLILYASTDEIGAFSGKIGRLSGVSIKTGISKSK
ncbi:MAG: CopG family transcriptional regulator [Spirochaetales bacterium]|nr:CopG family transcriptional regulator [Spirochaetales bacterium]